MSDLTNPPHAALRLGIVGGLGPASTAVLYDRITRRYYEATGGAYPSILIDSVAIDNAIESTFVGGPGDEHARRRVGRLFEDSFDLLSRAGCQAIAIACNTAHFWAEPIAREKRVRFLSMTRATMEAAAARGLRRGLLLSSAGTSALRIYDEHAAPRGITLVDPSPSEQDVVSECILRLVREPRTDAIRAALTDVVARHAHAIDFVVLGCTDLSAVWPGEVLGHPTFDSLDLLAEACVSFLRERPSPNVEVTP